MANQNKEPNKTELGQVYSHFSRLYNSAVNILTSIIIGWAAFVGFVLNAILPNPPYPVDFFGIVLTNRYIILLIGFVIVVVGVFDVYFRVLHFGRMLWRLENKSGLRPYLRKLPKLPIIDKMTERRADLLNWTIGEILTSVILTFYFGVPLWLMICGCQ